MASSFNRKHTTRKKRFGISVKTCDHTFSCSEQPNFDRCLNSDKQKLMKFNRPCPKKTLQKSEKHKRTQHQVPKECIYNFIYKHYMDLCIHVLNIDISMVAPLPPARWWSIHPKASCQQLMGVHRSFRVSNSFQFSCVSFLNLTV